MASFTRALLIASLMAFSVTGCDDAVQVCRNCFDHDVQKPLSDAQARSLDLVSRVNNLPPEARNVYFQETCGMDCMQLIRFDLPANVAHDVMKRYSTVGIRKLSVSDQNSLLRAQDKPPLTWWLKEPIPNVEGVSSDLQAGQLTEFILVPMGKDMRVYMRAFTM